MTLAATMEMVKNPLAKRSEGEGVVVHISSARITNPELLERIISALDSTDPEQV